MIDPSKILAKVRVWIDAAEAEYEKVRPRVERAVDVALAAIKAAWSALKAFGRAFWEYVIVPAEDAITSHLSAKEFVDAVVVALAAGGGLANILIFMASNVDKWLPGVPDSTAVVVATILTLAARLAQRYVQGSPKSTEHR